MSSIERLTIATHGSPERAPLIDALLRSRSQEIVIGLVGRVSSGTSTTGNRLAGILENDFGYQAYSYKMSNIIRFESGRVWPQLTNQYAGTPKRTWLAKISAESLAKNETVDGEELRRVLRPHMRIELLQDLGNLLRANLSSSYLAERVVLDIGQRRDKWTQQMKKVGAPDLDILRGPRYAHIIDSLKHPDEARLFRAVYGGSFFLLAVMASSAKIRSYLREENMTDEQITTLIERDAREKSDEGQKVESTTLLADVFVRNEFTGLPDLQNELRRYMKIIFDVEIVTPTQEESAMLYAAAAAVRSSCLSQQVGASIVSQTGELLAVGCNDVPQSGGGLYAGEGRSKDCRCFRPSERNSNGFCRKDDGQRVLFDEIRSAVTALGAKVDPSQFAMALRATTLRSFLEQSRSIHAEMDALMSVARTGTAGLRGSTLYTTVFPCHICARHIVASGIKRVVFLAPYEKSLALDLHGDAIALEESSEGKVVFSPYNGVAPHNMVQYFRKREDRKDSDGNYLVYPTKNAVPIDAPQRVGSEGAESFIIRHHLKEKTNGEEQK
jgi:deoxycytidylate deaminase